MNIVRKIDNYTTNRNHYHHQHTCMHLHAHDISNAQIFAQKKNPHEESRKIMIVGKLDFDKHEDSWHNDSKNTNFEEQGDS